MVTWSSPPVSIENVHDLRFGAMPSTVHLSSKE